MKKSILKKEGIIILLLILDVILELISIHFGYFISLDFIRIILSILLVILLGIILKKSIKEFKEKSINNSRNNILLIILAMDSLSISTYNICIFGLIFLKYLQLILLSIGFIFYLKKKDLIEEDM